MTVPFPLLWIAIVPAIAAFVSGGIALYAWQRREINGARDFALCTASTFVWCFFSVFEFLSTEETARIVFGKAQYFGISFFAVFWFTFTLRYAQCDGRLNRKTLSLLSVIPLLSLGLALSDRWHGWVWQSAILRLTPYPQLDIVHGWWFNYVMIPQCYVLLLAGMGVLLGTSFTGSRLYRRQTLVLLLAAIAPFVCNVLYVISGITLYGLDLTPVGFAIAGLLVQLGLFRAQFLKVVPVSYKTVFLNTADAVILLDSRYRIVDLNPSAQSERCASTAGASAIGCRFEQIFPLYGRLLQTRQLQGPSLSELTQTIQLPELTVHSPSTLSVSPIEPLPASGLLASGGAYREVKVRSLTTPGQKGMGWVVIIRDVTLEKQQQAQLEQLAYVDSLTGLFNRRQLELKAREVLREYSSKTAQLTVRMPQQNRLEPTPVALLYADLNHFKPINDDYGHEVGDVVLKHFANCFKRSVRKGDIVVRLGGDEFAALLYQADRSAALEVRDRLQTILKNAVKLAGYTFTLSASIGIAYYPDDGHSLKTLLHCADQNMYEEKRLMEKRLMERRLIEES